MNTPRDGQIDNEDTTDEEYKGDKATALAEVNATVKSEAQKKAVEAALKKYNEKTKTALEKYKD